MMATQRQRPSTDQWAKLDAALEGLRERTPPQKTTPLSREISQRADVLHAALESGWRIRDLVAFFREVAGIHVSSSTIQTALRQALTKSNPDTGRSRAKRPPKKRPIPSPEVATGTACARNKTQTGVASLPDESLSATDVSGNVSRPRVISPLGSTLTQGATKRGQR